ncbi:unnamed protein product [Rhizophagus irregularis]|nr:unnamed protein product [Rhizophagus irregularis]
MVLMSLSRTSNGSSPKTNENLNGTWNKRFVTAVERLKIKEIVDEPDWSRIFEERFKMQISSSRREKTYTMYSNENEHVGEQLLEDQRKRTREDETITSDTKKAKRLTFPLMNMLTPMKT